MERDINYTTDRLQQLRGKRARCRRMIGHEKDSHGAVSDATNRVMIRIVQDIKEESAYIARKIFERNAHVPPA